MLGGEAKGPEARTGGEAGGAAGIVHLLWLAGASCDGCTMAMLGATQPSIEELLLGRVSDAPSVALLHPTLSVASGERYVGHLERAARGEVTPLVVVVEGSIFEESLAGAGSFSRLGELSVAGWVDRLAHVADAMVAIGSCATWGGIPAAHGNVTGAHGLGQHLGRDYRTRRGLPVINVPGCAPSGNAFVETLVYVLLHLRERVPLELDEQHRPRWLYNHHVSPAPPRVEGVPIDDHADVSVSCPVPVRGWMRGIGGCARVGGSCIGCTAPDFADRFLAAAKPRNQL